MQIATAVGVVLDQLQQRRQTLAHGVGDPVLGVQRGLLGHISHAQPLLHMQLTVIGALLSAQDFEQRRLAAAVAADQAHALAGLE